MDVNEHGPNVKPHLVTVCPDNFKAKSSLQRQGPISNQHKVTPIKLATFQCSECFTSKQVTKVFLKRYSLNAHIQQCHGEPRFKCQVCFKPFTRLNNLKQHMHVHSLTPDNNKNKCDICKATFISKCHLKRHLFEVHKQKVEDFKYLKCEFCSQEFVNKYYLEKHLVEEHVVDKEFECPTCSKTFIDQQLLDQHMRRHDVELKHFFQVCFVGFQKRFMLSKHLKVKHSQLYCKKCFTSFGNKLEFDQHLYRTTGLKFKCEICSDILNSQCNLNIHTNSHLKESKIEQDSEKFKLRPAPQSTETKPVEIHCDLCLKRFDCESNFRSHQIQVHPKATWPCNFEQCSKSFKYYSKLKKHKAIHSNYKNYKCAICPRYVTLPRNVKLHVANQHGGPTPFKCPVKNCGAQCFNYSTVHRHLVCHQTENNNLFKCHICTELKTFTTSSNFKQHHRLHSNINTSRNSLTSKTSDDPVYVCSFSKCFFQTRSEKNVALHFNQQHGLPIVVLSQNIIIESEVN